MLQGEDGAVAGGFNCTSPLLDCTRWQRPQDRLLIQEHLPNLVAGPVQDREISIKVEKGRFVK